MVEGGSAYAGTPRRSPPAPATAHRLAVSPDALELNAVTDARDDAMLSGDMVHSLFEPVITSITDHVSKLTASKPVKYIFLVGGFAGTLATPPTRPSSLPDPARPSLLLDSPRAG